MVIHLTLEDYLALVRHARTVAPIEDCGLLGGIVEDGAKVVKKVFYLTNTDTITEELVILFGSCVLFLFLQGRHKDIDLPKSLSGRALPARAYSRALESASKCWKYSICRWQSAAALGIGVFCG